MALCPVQEEEEEEEEEEKSKTFIECSSRK
jgi:hypothetical protein